MRAEGHERSPGVGGSRQAEQRLRGALGEEEGLRKGGSGMLQGSAGPGVSRGPGESRWEPILRTRRSNWSLALPPTFQEAARFSLVLLFPGASSAPQPRPLLSG